jgi:hypothetical protein
LSLTPQNQKQNKTKKRQTKTNVEDVERWEPTENAGGNVKWSLGKQFVSLLKKGIKHKHKFTKTQQPKRNENIFILNLAQKCSRIICKSQKWENNLNIHQLWTNKQNVVYLYSGMVIRNKKEQSIGTLCNMNEYQRHYVKRRKV